MKLIYGRVLAAMIGVIGLPAMLAGCDGRSSEEPAESSTEAVANWTTLGTRALTSQPGVSITRNGSAQWVDYDPPEQFPRTVTQPLQYITLPDGTQLAASLTLPADSDGNAIPGRFPTILIQTPYNTLNGNLAAPFIPGALGPDPYLIKHGYAAITVDVRGTGQSTGTWNMFGSIEQADAGNVVDWVLEQPWCDGRIGVSGASYLGITALQTAAQGHPAIKAAFPVVALNDAYRDISLTGGQINLGFVPLWLTAVFLFGLEVPSVVTHPAQGIPALLDHILGTLATHEVPLILETLLGSSNTAYDGPAGSYWGERSPSEKITGVNVPTFIVGGLQDIFQRSAPMNYEMLKTQVPVKLLIGPWEHFSTGTGLPADGVPVLSHIQLQWFDQYVKGMNVGADKLPNVTQYVLGHDHYVTATDWPHPQVRAQKLYLRGDLSLSHDAPVKAEASNRIAQLPIQGLCSASASQWTGGLLGFLPLPCFTENSFAEAMDARYETAPLEQDMYINGPIQVDVWMSTTANDAGLAVRVDDVDERGRVIPLTNGIQTASLRAVDPARSRYMNGLMIQPWHPFTPTSVLDVRPGVPMLVSVEVFPTSAKIAKGHRLRMSIGASDTPHGLPPLPTLINSVLGVMTIYSDADRPSSAVIPVVPASALH